jgi:hypothetical protein
MAWAALIPVLGSVIDKLLPDQQQAADAKLKLVELAQAGEMAALDADLKIAMGQVAINTEEAKSPDNFRAGWRPAAGWVCVFGLFYQFLLVPLLPWVVNLSGHTVPPLPAIDNETLMGLLMGMLGLGGFRTFERIKGKA